MFFYLFSLLLSVPQPLSLSCSSNTNFTDTGKAKPQSWTSFLQHLPVIQAPVVDYRGRKISNQDKASGIIPFDVGTDDLQQCADALMRLRAEYLFANGDYKSIGFHFTNGIFYQFTEFCEGVRPIADGNRLVETVKTTQPTHQALRNYLDIIYAFAGTLSLEKELKPAADFGVGTIVIHGGSPGHCFIIIDEKKDAHGDRLFKLAEGYTPAQSIYVVSNPFEPAISPWYRLKKGPIYTASYTFTSYSLRTFE